MDKILEILLAHSKDTKRGIPGQPYSEHIINVVANAVYRVDNILKYYSGTIDPKILKCILVNVAIFHDLGKLDEQCQSRLKLESFGPMLNHVDAGSALLIKCYKSTKNSAFIIAAILIHGHHIGFFNDRSKSGLTLNEIFEYPNIIRDQDDQSIKRYFSRRVAACKTTVEDHVDESLMKYLSLHLKTTNLNANNIDKILYQNKTRKNKTPQEFTALDFRVLASCFVSADHGDAIRNMRYPTITKDTKQYELQPARRRKQLETKMKQYGKIGELKGDDRAQSRQRLFRDAKLVPTHHGFYELTSAVGSGKTLTSMEASLKIAEEHNSRRIFSIAPFNSIIEQTVQVYRDNLILPEEYYYPDKIVAAHYCNNDYSNQLVKAYNVCWESLFIITTAVQLIETLSSNIPSRIKKLHNLIGSVIILDEWHTLIPIHLWGIFSHWLHQLVTKWGCKVIYSSGTPVDFWNIKSLALEKLGSLKLIAPTCKINRSKVGSKQLTKLENARVKYKNLEIIEFAKMADTIFEHPGPRLVVCSTVQNAAVLAQLVSLRYGRNKVEHLSSALNPHDRKITLEKVKNRLKNNEQDWVLIATSCVESGVDISFRTGFGESREAMATLQLGGRVNREFKWECSTIFNFDFLDCNWKTVNPGFQISTQVLKSLWKDNCKFSPEICSMAVDRELEMSLGNKKIKEWMSDLMTSENTFALKEINRNVQVITMPTISVLTHASTFYGLLTGDSEKNDSKGKRSPGSPSDFYKDMQEYSFQIHLHTTRKPDKYPLTRLSNLVKFDFETDDFFHKFNPEDIYIWSGGYDNFLGYMNEILLAFPELKVEQASIPWEINN